MADILEFIPFTSSSGGELKEMVEKARVSEPPSDSAARAHALDAQRSFIVAAPAGSGKTGLLVQRFLNLLGSPATSAPEEILAITFTRKATAELRERIFAQLEAAAVDQPLADPDSPFEQKTRALALAALERDRQLGWRLLTEPRRLRVQTIDALCMEIAATLPLLSGSAARKPVDDASELYRHAARNALRQLGGSDRLLHNALYAILLHRDGNLADLERLLAEMLQTREQWAELVPLDRASLSDQVLDQQVRLLLERTLEHIVCAGLTRVLKAIPASILAELATLAHNYSGEEGWRGRELPIRLCSDRPGPPAAEAEHLEHWRALISLLLTKDCEWRKSFAISTLLFKPSKVDEVRLKQIIADIQCDPLREALEAVRSLPPARYPDDQWQQAKALLRLLLHALAELRLLFAETGECDFTEFSLAARQALTHHAEDFTLGSGVTLRHLLVDEMQDTSSAQYALLTTLTRSWDGSSQTLFLVGDPKQSIYLFRQARVERFLRTTHEGMLGDVPLHPLQLTANFRSRPEVVNGVNRDFERLFAAPGQPLSPDTADVPFVAATPTRSPTPASGVHWHTRILASQPLPTQAQPDAADTSSEHANPVQQLPGASLVMPDSSSSRVGFDDAQNPQPLALAASAEATLAEEDAKAIRHVVERWRATPLPPNRTGNPWRIAVLAYSRRHLAPIAAEFSRPDAPVPYRAVKVEPLADRPEVMDALALTRALHHPADRIAWFAVLRAPWCGLGAADLLTLAAEGNPLYAKSTVPQLVADRASLLSAAGAQLFNRMWPVLQVALERTSKNLLSALVERAWRSLGGNASLTSDQRSNVDRYFALLRGAEANSRLDLRQLNRRLKDLYAESTSTPDAVELMTIHGAKGLEWDVVLVPELGRQGQREASRLLNWLELESGGEPAVLLAPIHGKGDDPTSLYKWLSRIQTRRHEAERKRVFYVACTRAREELHLFATAKQGRSTVSPAVGSLLHACWPAAATHFAQNNGSTTSQVSVLTIPQSAPSDTGLALAAAAEPASTESTAAPNRYLPRLTRLPLDFDPQRHFREVASRRLPYTLASALPHQQPLTRPEGSIAVRALGNVVHRFLELLATQLTASRSGTDLKAELPTWLDRLTASLRSEGLAPPEASREASRALALLSNTLADPVGLWLLSPQESAASEHPLATTAGLLRVDRTFHAGSTPHSAPDGTIWVVDFKTTAPGGKSQDDFLAAQRATYGPQLARYAAALRAAAPPETAPAPSIQLGLYFPAIPRLIHWPAELTRSELT